jgi:hypothetical protein
MSVSNPREFTYFEDKGINPPKTLREVFEPRFADRVVELRRVPANTIKPNPHNWRIHPQTQVAALESMLSNVGFTDAVIARETDDGLELIDGHLRREILGDDIIPVLVVNVSEEESKQMLATFDPIAALAETNTELLSQLLEGLDFNSAIISEMLDDLRAESTVPLPTDTDPPEEFPTFDDTVKTDYCCPSCGYEWSGQPK